LALAPGEAPQPLTLNHPALNPGCSSGWGSSFFEGRRSPTGSSGHKLGKVCAEALQITQRIKSEGGAMRSFHNNSFDPQTLLLLETAFDEA